MSEPTSDHGHGAATVEDHEPKFVPEELVEFKADDAEAGKRIGQMLVLFFITLFTLVTTVNLFTSGWVNFRDANATKPHVTEEHHE
ncbi:MAG: hypothetical protein U0903_13055 [Planctomycetales bacterium]